MNISAVATTTMILRRVCDWRATPVQNSKRTQAGLITYANQFGKTNLLILMDGKESFGPVTHKVQLKARNSERRIARRGVGADIAEEVTT
jgi:hypothetical protein